MLFHNSERLNQVVFGVMYDIRYIHPTYCNKKQIFTQKTKTSKLQILDRNLYAKTDMNITATLFWAIYILHLCMLCSTTNYSYSILVYTHKIYSTYYSVSHTRN